MAIKRSVEEETLVSGEGASENAGECLTPTTPKQKKSKTTKSLSPESLLSKPDKFFSELSKEELVQALQSLVKYTKKLGGTDGKSAGKKGEKDAFAAIMAAPKQKSKEQVEAEVEKLIKVMARQIKAQMKWKPSCKNGNARWSYESICTGPEIFKALINEEKCNFKKKRIPLSEFEDLFRHDSIQAKVRYDYLYLRGDFVTISWNADTCEFAFSGKYGL